MRIIAKNARIHMCVMHVFIEEDKEIFINVRVKKRDKKRYIKIRENGKGCIRKKEKKECWRKSGVTP